MSGYKLATISITSEDFERFYQSQFTENTIKSVPEPSPELMDFVGSQSTEILETSLNNLQVRQEAFHAMVSGGEASAQESVQETFPEAVQEVFQEDAPEAVQPFEDTTSQALIEFETEVIAHAEQYIGHMWSHFDKVIAEVNDQFNQRIEANFLETQASLAELYREMRQAATNANQKRQMADQWLAAAEQYCQYIKQYYPYEQFTPGRVEWLERQLDQAQQNLEAGLFEAAIASAQQVYLSFSELRIDLERSWNEWILLYQAAWEAINRLLIQANDCQFAQAVDLDGNLIPTEIDIEYWSDGLLSQLYARAEAICSQMADENRQPDRELLRRWLEEEIPAFQDDLENLVAQARVNVINSQLRINIADLVVRALQEQGFALDLSDYAGSDMRTAYRANLSNIEGNQVMVQVAPTGQKIGENELHLQSMDSEQRTEHELEQRWYEISRSLNHQGVEVGPYKRLDQGCSTMPYPAQPGLLYKRKTPSPGLRNSHGNRTGPPDHQER